MPSESEADPGDLQYLFQHIGNKGVQAGSIVGTFASTPVLAILHKRRGGLLDSEFTPRAMKAISLTTLTITTVSLMAGLGLIGGKEGFDQERIGDRVYRLRENKQQNRCDHFAYGGALGGAALSCLRGYDLPQSIGDLPNIASVWVSGLASCVQDSVANYGFPQLRTFAGMSFIGTAAGVLVHVITSQEEESSKVEALQKSTANMAKELS